MVAFSIQSSGCESKWNLVTSSDVWKEQWRNTLCQEETKVFSVHKGNMMASQGNPFLGQLPTWLVIGMVENKVFSGEKTKKSYKFKNFDANCLALHLNRLQIPAKNNWFPSLMTYCSQGVMHHLSLWMEEAFSTLWSQAISECHCI